ncbi:MAG: D-glycero-beta-D-manno-heptose 1-phosphate adenylyltransferase [Candidatus Omnitrophica bacterium]|nr:D-glycero-beta-D-manno-heptose 1-phosphate adenylyltransferase [Candidatus Omnitrophota bacterium]
MVFLESRLKVILSRERKKGKKIVFTNGCFDILHQGHIKILEAAKSKGDILVVGLNSDKSVRGLKGKGRPIQGEKERARILASLRMVDYVVIFNESTPLRLIKSIKPDVLVKGSDYRNKKVVGGKEVKEAGGKVYLFPVVKGYSSTDIIKKL